MRDSEWISTLLRAGLLNGSFIPEKRIHEFLDLNRYHKSVLRDITSQKNRVEKYLQSSAFRLSSFISDISGASERNIILHLMEHGQIDRTALDSCLKTKTRNRIDEQVEQFRSIYGISTTASCAIIAEICIDTEPFKTAEHICS